MSLPQQRIKSGVQFVACLVSALKWKAVCLNGRRPVEEWAHNRWNLAVYINNLIEWLMQFGWLQRFHGLLATPEMDKSRKQHPEVINYFV
jgi:hypothetical protein